MAEWITWLTQTLWRNGLAVVPMALIVWLIARWGVSRPATRHALWLGALVWLFAAVLLRPMSIGQLPFDSRATANVADAARPIDPLFETTLPRGARRIDETQTCDASICSDVCSASVAKDATICLLSRKDSKATTLFNTSPTDSLEPMSPNYSADDCEPVDSIPPIASCDLAVQRDPTPPTTVARPTKHGLSHQNAVHDSVGQSSPFSVAFPAPDAVALNTDCCPPLTDDVSLDDCGPAIPIMKTDSNVGDMTKDCADSPPELDAAIAKEPAAGQLAETVGMIAEQSGVRAWISAWAGIRDSIGALPAIPKSLWIGVAMFLVTIKGVACYRFQRRLRRARPASDSVRAMVRACGASIGLKSIPATYFVSDRISPMVVCGWRPRLVIPKALWSELDSAGRRAVILHELAHLRRRDHLTHWFDCLIGVLYWWHPVVWWIRHRLRDEAENACDAWVTWFEPRERRAYATALLQARKFLSECRNPMLVPSVGVMSPQATRFSRRLTMVMTNRVSPRACSCGVLAIPFLFLAAWISMPADSSACPPKDCEKVEPVKLIVGEPAPEDGDVVYSVAETASPDAVVVGGSGGRVLSVAPRVNGSGENAEIVLTVSDRDEFAAAEAAYVAAANWHEPGHDSDERIARLEKQMAELHEKLSILIERQHPGAAQVPSAPSRSVLTPRTPRPPMAPSGLRRSMGASPAPQAIGLYGDAGGVVIRQYQLPKKKLAALTKLMSRSDVPTRVRAVSGGIEVHANEADQAKFAAFVAMISGDGMDHTRAYRLSEGKLKDLTALMAQDEVPVMIRYGNDDIKVQGSELIQQVFREFVEMIEPDSRGANAGSPGPADMAVAELEENLRAGMARQAIAHARARQDMDAARESAAGARMTIAQLKRQYAELQAQVSSLEAMADKLSDKADQLRDQAEEMRERAEEANSRSEAEQLEAAVLEMTKAAEDMDREAASVYRQSQLLETQAEDIESQIDSATR